MNLAYTSMLTMEWSAVVNGHGLSLAILLLSSSVAMCTYEGNGNQEHISKSLVHEKDHVGTRDYSHLTFSRNASGCARCRHSWTTQLTFDEQRAPMSEFCMCSLEYRSGDARLIEDDAALQASTVGNRWPRKSGHEIVKEPFDDRSTAGGSGFFPRLV